MNWGARVAVLLVALACAACGGGEGHLMGPTYSGDKLLLNGNTYGPVPSEAAYAPGLVIVQPRAGSGARVVSLLQAFGLTVVHQSDVFDYVTAGVPPGFDTQWVSALRDMPEVENAWLNFVYYPAR